MRSDKFSKLLSARCSTCGGTTFECEAEAGPYRCVGCDRVFQTEELLRENGDVIDFGVEEMAPKVARHAHDELRKSLRKTLSGSKHLKLK